MTYQMERNLPDSQQAEQSTGIYTHLSVRLSLANLKSLYVFVFILQTILMCELVRPLQVL